MDVSEIDARVARVLKQWEAFGLSVIERESGHVRFIPAEGQFFIDVEYGDLPHGTVTWSYGEVGDTQEIAGHQRFHARVEDFLENLAWACDGIPPGMRMSPTRRG